LALKPLEEEKASIPPKEAIVMIPVGKPQLNKLKVAELRSKLEEKGCKTTGTKPVLIDRLLEVLNNEEKQVVDQTQAIAQAQVDAQAQTDALMAAEALKVKEAMSIKVKEVEAIKEADALKAAEALKGKEEKAFQEAFKVKEAEAFKVKEAEALEVKEAAETVTEANRDVVVAQDDDEMGDDNIDKGLSEGEVHALLQYEVRAAFILTESSET